jgi:hypothetical protein
MRKLDRASPRVAGDLSALTRAKTSFKGEDPFLPLRGGNGGDSELTGKINDVIH